jgi:CubicO group peptidase (beta-lactamase class C family)
MPTTEAATGLPVAEPEEVGLSAERLARIGPVMQEFIDAGEIPGCVTLVARRGKVAHLEARGRMHLDRAVPLRTDAIFRIASATKPIAAVALLLLYEDGRLLLDEPVSRFIPAFKELQVEVRDPGTKQLKLVRAEREVTVRDCLTHTVGFAQTARGTIADRLAARSEEPVAETVARLTERPLTFQPGARWEYSAGITVVGHLVELLSGMDLDTFLRARLFEPLGMSDTSFYLPPEKTDRFPSAYNLVDREGRWDLEEVDRAETSPKVNGPRVRFDGNDGLLSTAADYARIAQMLLNGGTLDGTRILGRKTVELMTVNHTGDLDVYLMGRGFGFGLGVSVRTDLGGVPLVGSVGSYGWGGVWGVWYQAGPVEQMVTLFFTQANGYWQQRLARLRFGRPGLRWLDQFEALAHQALI